MENSYENKSTAYEKDSSFKIYNIKASFSDYLTKDILKSLKELKGKAINNIPFISTYLKADICKLEEVVIGEECIFYRLDFQKESIVYEGNMPKRVLMHEQVEFVHYFSLNIGYIYEVKAVDSMKVLSIGMVLAYWSLIGNYFTRDVPFGKPIIEELTLDLNGSLEFLEEYLLKYIKCSSSEFGVCLDLMENWWESEMQENIYEAKLFRKSSIKYTLNLHNGEKYDITFLSNGQVKSSLPLSKEFINKYLIMIIFITENPEFCKNAINILDVLEEWITYISPDMFEESKLKKKIAVINDLQYIISEALKGEELVWRKYMDILELSLYAQELFAICSQTNLIKEEKENIDIIEYDSLCTFLKWYMNKKLLIKLSDTDLEIAVQKISINIRRKHIVENNH